MLSGATEIKWDTQLLVQNTKNKEALLDASNKSSLEVNTEKTGNVFMSHHQTRGQRCYIKVSNRSFDNEAKFKYALLENDSNKIIFTKKLKAG
jgi:hypothetical protein